MSDHILRNLGKACLKLAVSPALQILSQNMIFWKINSNASSEFNFIPMYKTIRLKFPNVIERFSNVLALAIMIFTIQDYREFSLK